MTTYHIMGRGEYGSLGSFGEQKAVEDRYYRFSYLEVPHFLLDGKEMADTNIAATSRVNFPNSGPNSAYWMPYDSGFIANGSGPDAATNKGLALRAPEDFGIPANKLPMAWHVLGRYVTKIYQQLPNEHHIIQFYLPSVAEAGGLTKFDLGWLIQGKPLNPTPYDFPAEISCVALAAGNKVTPKYLSSARDWVILTPPYVTSPMWKMQYQTSINPTWRDCLENAPNMSIPGVSNYSKYNEFYAGMDSAEKVPTSITINFRFAFKLNPSVVGAARSFVCTGNI